MLEALRKRLVQRVRDQNRNLGGYLLYEAVETILQHSCLITVSLIRGIRDLQPATSEGH